MYLLLALAVIYHTGYCALEEPKCTMHCDCEPNLLYKLKQIEEEMKGFRVFIKNLKVRQTKAENEQTQKLGNVLDDFKHMEESMDNFNQTLSKLHEGSAIGFSVKDPKAGLASGELTFKTVITNSGNSFDITTGKFTCNTPGYYYFSVALLKEYDHDSASSCWVYKNSEHVVSAYTIPGHTPRTGNYPAVNNVFIHLDTGDTVNLAACSVLSSFQSYSSFSGFLVTADSN